MEKKVVGKGKGLARRKGGECGRAFLFLFFLYYKGVLATVLKQYLKHVS